MLVKLKKNLGKNDSNHNIYNNATEGHQLLGPLWCAPGTGGRSRRPRRVCGSSLLSGFLRDSSVSQREGRVPLPSLRARWTMAFVALFHFEAASGPLADKTCGSSAGIGTWPRPGRLPARGQVGVRSLFSLLKLEHHRRLGTASESSRSGSPPLLREGRAWGGRSESPEAPGGQKDSLTGRINQLTP